MSDDPLKNEIPLTVAFPLPYRVFALVGLGILGWATNLHGLDLLGVDAVGAMDLRTDGVHNPLSHRASGYRQTHATPPVLYAAAYRIFTIYTSWCFLSWAYFRYHTFGDQTLVDTFGIIPALTALIIICIVLCPFDVMHKSERDKFVGSLKRCLFSPMDSPVYFADVVFADILTSFAKVLGDVWLSLNMLFPGRSLLSPTALDGWQQWILPVVMSLPYLVRFRQCLIEYNLPETDTRRPLYNALKYATAFPVIFLSAAQRTSSSGIVIDGVGATDGEPWRMDHLFRLWLLAAAINSLYSFWWDLTNDWGLDLLKPASGITTFAHLDSLHRIALKHNNSSSPLLLTSETRSTPGIPRSDSEHSQYSHPYGLRPTLLYPLPVYPLVVFFNLILRLTWSIKLSSHLHSVVDGSVTIFWLEMAELVRRWMWVFVRVEWEVIKKAREGFLGVQTSDPVVQHESNYELDSPTNGNTLVGLSD
ncbi:EXS family-domain-containing protein [Infundibulicybe gibba]|nr:EXS family-domain-containing protein [Infundibulicybe gibba]